MSSTFADTHNMVAILTKSKASEGFTQIIDFLNGSYIKYALTVNPHIYASCIKQFWNTVTVKQSNDVTRLQALVDIKKVVLSEAVIRDVLCLHNVEGVNCLPNEESFARLDRMGYEKPSTKLTFYKSFFSSQWKFLIHTILQSMSSAMTSDIICLSTGRKFNFSKYIFESLVRNVNSSSKFYMYPRFIQLIIQNQIGDLFSHTTKYTSPSMTQKVFMNIRRVGKGFSRVETPLFEGILVVGENVEEGIVEERVQDDAAAQDGVSATIEEDVQHTPPSSPQPQPQAQPQAADFPLDLLQITLDACAALTSRIEQLESKKVSQALEITKLKKRVKRLEKGHKVKVLKLRRLKKVGTSQRINTSDDTIMEDVSNQGRMIDELDRDEGVVLMGEKEEEKKTKKVKDIAGDDQVEGRQAEIQAEIYQIDMDHPSKVLIMQEDEPAKVEEVVEVVTTAKLIKEVVTTAKAPIEEEERRAIESINETPAQKAAKRKKLNEEVVEFNKHLEIVPDEDDDVFTEATPLAREVPVVDYSIIHLNNKPHYKIVKADGTHQLYVSFLTLLKNFDRDDLKSLRCKVKERFSTTKPDNFTDDFLLTTLGAMFEKADDQA
uniref:Xylulose kinase-1 n=1 Tax=Tanacetum cinerariifolium TaxID=118510 RepID=A0A6L2MWY8_TANCI|nr:hypothetical protein [Tanacetum cinerariifolium]